jgi:hypothetical protein
LPVPGETPPSGAFIFGGTVFSAKIFAGMIGIAYFCNSFYESRTKRWESGVCGRKISLQKNYIMAVSQLKRKALRNRARSSNRVDKIKQLMKRPDIRNVDVEAIKAEFARKLASQKA